MTTPEPPVEFEWVSADPAIGPTTTDSATGLKRPKSAARSRLLMSALVVAVLVVAAVVVVLAMLQSDDDAAASGLVEPGRLPLTVEMAWTQTVEVGIEPASVRVADDAVVFIVADRGGSFRKVEALDLATGGSLWERRSGTDVVTNLVTVTENTYVVETTVDDDRRLVGYDLATGATAWEEQLDGFGLIVALASVPLLVEVPNGPERVTSLRDADSGEVVAEFDASYAGVDLAGRMRLIDADGTLLTLDLAAFEAIRRDRGIEVALTAVKPVVRGTLTRAGGAAIVGGELISANERVIENAAGAGVPVRGSDGESVELAAIVGVRPVAADRLVIETFDGVGGSFLHGGVLRRGTIEIEWTFEGFSDRGADVQGEAFLSESGERAIVVTRGDGEPGSVGLLDLVTGERLAEFESPLRPERLTAGNGVLTNAVSVDGLVSTAIAYDQGGSELWRIGPTRGSLGAAIGDEFVVTLARDADGEVVMTGYGP